MAAKAGLATGAEEDSSRPPWPGLLTCDFDPPSIDYGVNSMEKTAQKQRENSVLQALFFNSRLPNDPSEPETIGFPKGIVTKHIPLEDESGEDITADYSGEGWPLPTSDEFSRVSAVHPRLLKGPVVPQAADAIYASIQQNLQNMMGLSGTGTEDEVSAGMNIAMYAAQKAAEEALRLQGLLPPLATSASASGPEGAKKIAGTPFPLSSYSEDDQTNEPYEPDMDYGDIPAAAAGNGIPGVPMQASVGMVPEPGLFTSQMAGVGVWRGGPRIPHFHHLGGTGSRDFRGGLPGREFRGGQHRGRDFFPIRGGYRKPLGRGGRDGEERGSGRGDFREGGGFLSRRPCRFWVEKGFCREEDRCKFPHPR